MTVTEQYGAPVGVFRGAAPVAETTGFSGRKPLRRDIPPATVARLLAYLRVLVLFTEDAQSLVSGSIVSSGELANAAGVNSATLRKDVSFLGATGVPGVGYDVATLRTRIEDALGLSQRHRVVLLGAGNMGRALAHYRGFGHRGFSIVGVFDNDPAVVGSSIAGNQVRDIGELLAELSRLRPTIGVIAVPEAAAQQASDQLVAGGVRSLLSFASSNLIVPAHVQVRYIDLAVEMQLLSLDRRSVVTS